MQELQEIQSELKVPKNNMNKFGGYKYRSTEDILEALKPLLKKHKCRLVITDSIESIGGRNYVCAKAFLKNEGGKEEKAYGYAREPEAKKGFDESQITGAASSYARKYALNGLFGIDDTKDADTTNDHKEEPPKPKEVSKDTIIQTIQKATSLAGLNSIIERVEKTKFSNDKEVIEAIEKKEKQFTTQ